MSAETAAIPTAKASDKQVSNYHIRKNLSYLVSPQQSNQPARLKTRTILKTVRYVTIFIFWRALRTLRYALVGSLVAAVAGTALGPLLGGAAAILAPTGILAGAGAGVMWAIARMRWRKFRKTVKEGKGDQSNPRLDEKSDAGDVVKEKKEKSAMQWSNQQFDPLAA